MTSPNAIKEMEELLAKAEMLGAPAEKVLLWRVLIEEAKDEADNDYKPNWCLRWKMKRVKKKIDDLFNKRYPSVPL